eukprot:scaffold250640_cov52-Attheya_sp.AAC.2
MAFENRPKTRKASEISDELSIFEQLHPTVASMVEGGKNVKEELDYYAAFLEEADSVMVQFGLKKLPQQIPMRARMAAATANDGSGMCVGTELGRGHWGRTAGGREGVPGVVSISDIIEDDETFEEVLSFCDFRSTVMVGRTCRRLKSLSDTALDRWVEKALTRLPIDYENVHNSAEFWARANLRTGWSTNYRSRAALRDIALTHCDPIGSGDEVEYDEDKARCLLRGGGEVDVNDFRTDDADSDDSDDVGWNVCIIFRKITLTVAAAHIANAVKKIRAAGTDDWKEKEDEVEEVERLRHCTLCLLRKADPRSIKISHLVTENSQTDYGSGVSNFSVLFRIPDHDNMEVEFHLLTGFEDM